MRSDTEKEKNKSNKKKSEKKKLSLKLKPLLSKAKREQKLVVRFRAILPYHNDNIKGVSIRGLNGNWDENAALMQEDEEIEINGDKLRVFEYADIIPKKRINAFTLHQYKYFVLFENGGHWESLPKRNFNRVLKAHNNLELDYHIQHDVILFENEGRQKYAGLWLNTLPILVSDLDAEGVDNKLQGFLVKVEQIFHGYKESCQLNA